MERLKSIKDKTEEKLKTIKNKTENIKEVIDFVEEPLSLEAKGLIEEIKIIQKDVDYRKLKITDGSITTYDFSYYKTFKELFRDLYYRNMTIHEAERKQYKFDGIILRNVKKIYNRREKIIEGFKNGIFPLNYGIME